MLNTAGGVVEWLYHASHEFQHDEPLPDLALPAGDVVRLTTPLRDTDVHKLKVGARQSGHR